jgi:hypothetical protein
MPNEDDSSDVATWSVRIARAARRGQVHAIAAFVKHAAAVAAIGGHLDLLASWLSHIPAATIARDPHLSYWRGATLVLSQPQDAYAHYQRAFEYFSREEPESTAALLAWAGLLDAIFLLYRDLRELDLLLEWMTPEREQAVDRLPRPIQGLVVGSALFALAFRCPAHPRLPAWRERAEKLAEVNPTSEIGMRLISGLMIDYTLSGNLANAEVLWRRFAARSAQTKLSPMTSVMGRLNEATLRLHQGRLEECRDAVDAGLALSAASDVRIWDGILLCHGASASLSQGNIDAARLYLSRVEHLFAEGIRTDEAYYRHMLMWCDFVAGGRLDTVPRTEASLTTADVKGAPYFMAVARLSSGLVLHECGHVERGRELVRHGRALGDAIRNPMIIWVSGLFAAYMAYANGDQMQGDETLRTALELGRDYGLVHFFSWPRAIIIQLVERAFMRRYVPDYLARLIAVHALHPGNSPAESDAWHFAVKVYTFGEPRVVHADGRTAALSAQLLRQVELLAALIRRSGKALPINSIAAELYSEADVDASGSLKRVLHSLRNRLSHESILQRDAKLALNFEVIWVDAATLIDLRSKARPAKAIETWLDQHYHGHFLEGLEGSVLVDEVRRTLRAYAERVIADALNAHAAAEAHAQCARIQERWQALFPALFNSLGNQ